jgi:hypothetical protein
MWVTSEPVEPARAPHVYEATLELSNGIDPAEVGAAVTVELCGHWEHGGPCRWPHNNCIETDEGAARFRTLFVAPSAEAQEVHDRIELALRSAADWTVVTSGQRPLAQNELELAERLVGTD